MPPLKFESVNEAIAHATFVGKTIEGEVDGKICEFEPESDAVATQPDPEPTSEAPTALASFVDAAISVVNNFDGDKLYRWQLEQLCKGKQCGKADDLLGKMTEIRYVYFHPCEIVDAEDGEVSTMIRTVIMTPDLKATGFVSAGVATSMMGLFKLFDGKPFEPAVKVKIEQKTTRLGRRIYVVEPVMDSN